MLMNINNNVKVILLLFYSKKKKEVKMQIVTEIDIPIFLLSWTISQ
jgi:hypothetical protein